MTNRFGDDLQHWDEERYAGLPDPIKAGRRILQDWFEAMQADTAKHRRPNPLYPVAFTDEQVNEVIRKIDLSFAYEKWLVGSAYDEGPGFYRLAPQQRLALVQELHAVMKDHRTATKSWPHLYYANEDYMLG